MSKMDSHNLARVTCDMGNMEGGENSLNISGPQLLRFGSEGVLKIWRKTMTDLMNKGFFVEQPRLHQVC